MSGLGLYSAGLSLFRWRDTEFEKSFLCGHVLSVSLTFMVAL